MLASRLLKAVKNAQIACAQNVKKDGTSREAGAKGVIKLLDATYAVTISAANVVKMDIIGIEGRATNAKAGWQGVQHVKIGLLVTHA